MSWMPSAACPRLVSTALECMSRCEYDFTIDGLLMSGGVVRELLSSDEVEGRQLAGS
jgi:hypothetical protein